MFKRRYQNILIKTLWALSALNLLTALTASPLSAFTYLILEFKRLKRAKHASGDQALKTTSTVRYRLQHPDVMSLVSIIFITFN